MYDVSAYGEMIASRSRMDAFAAALHQTIRPGEVVIDIGTGTGVMALLACQAGAGRVYALDPSPAIEIARQAARDNGLEQTIVTIQATSPKVALPERADVIVSDLSGVLPLFGQHLVDIVDARTRLLKPTGRLIARAHTLRAALITAPELHRKQLGPWAEGVRGLNLVSGLRYATNVWRKARATPDQMLSAPVDWARLDYLCLDRADVRGGGDAIAGRAGTAHGLIVWFDAMLAEGVDLVNAPGAQDSLYGQAFFPWPYPVEVVAGQRVTFDIRADLVGQDYVWSWHSLVWSLEAEGACEHSFSQSTFFGAPLTKESLARRASSHRPLLGCEGEMVRFVLDRMDGEVSLQKLAEDLRARFPLRFATVAEALDFAGDRSDEYGQ